MHLTTTLKTAILAGLLLLGCSRPSTQECYKWPETSPAERGLDADRIAELEQRITSSYYDGIHSLIIIKDGMLVSESYANGYNRDSLHRIYSISKSLTSLLIGIAMDQGKISHEDSLLIQLMPDYAEWLNSPAKQSITLKHLLTMSAGIEWEENAIPFGNPANSHTRMGRSSDWHRFVLNEPMNARPGEKWVYNTAVTHLLGGILKHATGKHATAFAEQTLFKALDITEYSCNTDSRGYPCVGGSYGGFQMTTRDLAKLGQLVLNKGRWRGKQVVSESWIQRSTAVHIRATRFSEYGYQWWLDTMTVHGVQIKTVAGNGYGGQRLFIVPSLNLVIAITSWSSATPAKTLPVVLRTLKAVIPEPKS